MSEELRQAAEEIIELAESDDPDEEYLLHKASNLALKLASHYLATHREDDGDAITEEWLREQGFGNHEAMCDDCLVREVPNGLRSCWLVVYDDGSWTYSTLEAYESGDNVTPAFYITTRGQLRDLVRVLGGGE